MEILSHAVFPAERDDIAPQFLLASRGGYFGHVGSGFASIPVCRVDSLLQRIGMQVHALRAAIGPDDAGLDGGIASGQIGGVTNLCAQMDAAVIIEHGASDRSY